MYLSTFEIFFSKVFYLSLILDNFKYIFKHFASSSVSSVLLLALLLAGQWHFRLCVSAFLFCFSSLPTPPPPFLWADQISDLTF